VKAERRMLGMEKSTSGARPAAELGAACPEDQGGVAELGFGAGGRAVPEGALALDCAGAHGCELQRRAEPDHA
jgi:hypothetical protein